MTKVPIGDLPQHVQGWSLNLGQSNILGFDARASYLASAAEAAPLVAYGPSKSQFLTAFGLP